MSKELPLTGVFRDAKKFIHNRSIRALEKILGGIMPKNKAAHERGVMHI